MREWRLRKLRDRVLWVLLIDGRAYRKDAAWMLKGINQTTQFAGPQNARLRVRKSRGYNRLGCWLKLRNGTSLRELRVRILRVHERLNQTCIQFAGPQIVGLRLRKLHARIMRVQKSALLGFHTALPNEFCEEKR